MVTPQEAVRRSGTTWGFLLLVALVTALPLLAGVLWLLRAAGVLAVDREAALRDGLHEAGVLNDERSLRIAEGFAAAAALPVAVTCLVLLAGLLTWRPWAREGALGVFGLTGAALLLLSLNGLTNDPPGRHSGLGVVGALLVLATAALAVSPPVRADFERKELQRALAERAAAAARRTAAQAGSSSTVPGSPSR